MKKLIIALTVMAVASMASAAIVAEWTAAGANNFGAGPYAETGANGYSFSFTGGTWGSGAPAGATYAGGGADAASASAAFADGQYLYFTWDTGYTLTLGSAAAVYSRSGTGAPNAQWGTIIASTWSDIGAAVTGIATATPTTTTVPTTTTFTGVSGLTSGQLGLAFYGGSSSAASAWVRLDSRPSTTPQVALSLDGTMTPVPEPATMSLLGLGALAMVLRRKMSK